jgi:hypothetical protein
MQNESTCELLDFAISLEEGYLFTLASGLFQSKELTDEAQPVSAANN